MYLDWPSLAVRLGWQFSNKILRCWKTLFHGWNMLLLEVPPSPARPSRTQSFAVPMGPWWEGVEEEEWEVAAKPGDGEQGQVIRLTNILGSSNISNSQLDWTTCSTSLVPTKQHFTVFISSFFFPYFVRITQNILHTKFSSASSTLVFFSFYWNCSLTKGKPSAFVHCRSNLAKLHS